MKKRHGSAPCQHIEIAHSKLGEVLICPDCGVVHMSLQTISMRFDVDAFKEISKMLSRAQAVLEQAEKRSDMNIDGDMNTEVNQDSNPNTGAHHRYVQPNNTKVH
jgi:hypothetical protein